jgi:hypothetical protein
MKTPTLDPLTRAKSDITDWIDDLQVGGTELGPSTRRELLTQLESASPVRRHDGSIELVLPALSSLGIGIFQRSFRVETMLVRVVPYGAA